MSALLKSTYVTCPFGYVSTKKPSPWKAGYHPGVDFKAAIETDVFAPADFKVIHAGEGGWGEAYGIQIIGEAKGIDGKTYRFIVAHLSSEAVTVGKAVKQGAKIGESGETGQTFGPHVHLEVRKAPYGYWDHVDPKVILNVPTATPLPAPAPVVVNPPEVQPTSPTSLTILPRSAWTSTPNGRADRPLSTAKVNAFTIHYPGDGNVSYAALTQKQVAEKLERYRLHHVNDNDWADIGYNYAIDGSGRVWFLTGDTIGAHANAGGNPTSIGVLFLVGNREQPTNAALAAFRLLRAEKVKKFPKATKVQGHQQVPGNSTSCPGEPLMGLIKSGALTTPVPVPEPEPPQASSTLITVGYGNLYMGYDYLGKPDRASDVPKKWTPAKEKRSAQAMIDMRCSLYGIVEAHEENDMVQRWFKHWPSQFALDTGASRADGNGLIYDTKKYRILRDPVTINLPHARNMTRWNLMHLASQIPFWVFVYHLIAGQAAKRDEQMRVVIKESSFAKTAIHLADLNAYSTTGGPMLFAKQAGLTDVFAHIGQKNVVNGHLPTHDGGEPGKNLDHILTGERVTAEGLTIVETGDLSDHRWLKAPLRVKGAAA